MNQSLLKLQKVANHNCINTHQSFHHQSLQGRAVLSSQEQQVLRLQGEDGATAVVCSSAWSNSLIRFRYVFLWT